MLSDPISERQRQARSNTIAAYGLIAFGAAVIVPVSIYVVGTVEGAARLVAAFGVVVISLRAVLRIGSRIRPSGAERRVQPMRALVDPAVLKWRQEILYSAASRSYYERVFLPKLAALFASSGAEPSHPPETPRWRRQLGLGPRAHTLAAWISARGSQA